MKAELTKKEYAMLEPDESDLIPDKAKDVIVNYRRGIPISVYFSPIVEIPSPDDVSRRKFLRAMRKFPEQHEKESDKINSVMSQDEIHAVVNHLEASLVDKE